MPEYDKQRLKRVLSNAEKMKAAGCDAKLLIANEALRKRLEQVSKNLQNEGNLSEESEDMDCQLEVDNQDGDPQSQPLSEANRVTMNMKCSRGKKERKILTQTLPMAEFMRLKSQERQQQRAKEQRETEIHQSDIQLQDSTNVRSQQHKSKTQGQDEAQSSKRVSMKPQNQKAYCAPGSLLAYANMRRQDSTMQNKDVHLRNHDHSSPQASEDINVMASEEGAENNVNEVEDQTTVAAAGNVHVAENESAENNNAGNENPVPKEKRHRGRTALLEVHARTMDKRDAIILNSMHQPVGPTKEIVERFSRFLGTVAKDPILAPLNFISWTYVPTKEKIWEYVTKRYIVPNEGKKYVLQTVNVLWRSYKSRLKDIHYYPHKTLEERLVDRPEPVPVDQWTELVQYWETDIAKERSATNKRNREMQSDMHTMGPKSLAMLRHKLQQDEPNKKFPSHAEVYIESRKRTAGRTYLTQNEDTLENIEKMKTLTTLEDGSSKGDPYFDIITKKEHSGRVRLYGRGVTESKVKSKDGKTPFIVPSVFLDSITEQLEGKVREEIAAHFEETIATHLEEKLTQMLSKVKEANPGMNLVLPNFQEKDMDASNSPNNSVSDDSTSHSSLP